MHNVSHPARTRIRLLEAPMICVPGAPFPRFLSQDYYESKEGVACKVTGDVPIVIFASAGNRWARWLALSLACQLVERAGYIRPHNCCPDCAMRTVKEQLEIKPGARGGDPKLAYIILWYRNRNSRKGDEPTWLERTPIMQGLITSQFGNRHEIP